MTRPSAEAPCSGVLDERKPADAILWRDDDHAAIPTTFLWSGGPWTAAQSGVTVRIDSISDLVTTYPDVTKGDYQITLVEVDARTS